MTSSIVVIDDKFYEMGPGSAYSAQKLRVARSSRQTRETLVMLIIPQSEPGFQSGMYMYWEHTGYPNKIRYPCANTMPWSHVHAAKPSHKSHVGNTVEPRYNEVLGTMKITLLYQVSHYIRVKKQKYKELGPAKLPCYKRVLLYPTSL